MNKSLVVAKWEYFEKVKSKAFLVGLLLMPIIILLTSILPGLLAGREDEQTKIIGVIDASGERFDSLLSLRLAKYKLSNDSPNYILQPIAVGATVDIVAATAEADRKIAREDIEGYLVLGANVLKDTLVEYRSKAAGDIRLTNRVESALRTIIQEKKYKEKGLDPALVSELKANIDIKTVKISKSGKKEETDFMQTFFSAFIPLMVLFNLFITSGQLLVRSVLDEKSNRIVEILVSSCTAKDLMIGKLLGLCALGLTQIGFWALIGLGATAAFGTMASINFPPLNQFLLIGAYSVLGYLFYSALFITLGSPVTTEQEAQQVNSYLVMFLVLPIALVMPVLMQPNALWVKIISFIPLCTPTFMTLRILIQMPNTWEIIATMLLLLVSTYVMMIVAGKIFRIAILATGKRPRLGELWKWVRSPA